MICNGATRSPGEGIDHFRTKETVGVLADKYVSSLVVESGCRLMTRYEFPFIPLKLEQYQDVADRCYIGDVVLFIFKNVKTFQNLRGRANIYINADIQKAADTILNFEIDGIKGHSTTTDKMKNTIRDNELLKHYTVHVHRMPAIARELLDDYNEPMTQEILDFYFKHRPVILS